MCDTQQTCLYKDLNLSDGEIRVFWLSKGAKNDELEGRLEKRRLSQSGANNSKAEQFEALSYVWGGEPNPDDGFVVSINDSLLHITPSLDSFLRRLRSPSRPRLLWIDAICINQSDLGGELENQVRLMPTIYSTAHHVLVDLGQDTEDSRQALDLLKSAWNKYIWSGIANRDGPWTTEETAFWIGVDLTSDEERMKSRSVSLPSPGDRRWDSVARFFSRPWFSRLWIVQEFVLAREPILFHGTECIKWQELFAAVHSYAEGSPAASVASNTASAHGAFAYYFMGAIRRIRALAVTPEGVCFLERNSSRFMPQKLDRVRLSDLVHFFQASQSKRKRDRYFALTGIADDVGNETKLQPDYKSSLDDIITRFGEVMIQQELGEEVLLRAGLWQQHSPAVPTWIPDYARQEDILNFHRPMFFGPRYAAAGNTAYHVSTLTRRRDTILLRGAFIDVIEQKAFASPLDNLSAWDRSTGFRSFLEHHSLALRALIGTTTQSRYSQTGEPILDAVAITLICGLTMTEDARRVHVGFNGTSWMAVARNNRTTQADQWIYTCIKKHFGVPWKEIHQQLAEYNERVGISIRSRLQPVRTQRGYFANLPKCFEPGDQIWVIQGVRMPLVLRKSKVNQDCFQLVGSCYVHGWMNGEALRNCRCEFRQVAIH